MPTRYEEYRDRVHFKGNTKREYVKTKVKESIDSLIQDSQYGFTITVNGEEHEIGILSTKTTQEYESANIIAHLGFLEKGTIFNWENSDWIVLQKMFRPDQPGFNGIAYRCTGHLKWMDEDTGELYDQPAYIRSGRITNALGVTPDKNQVYDNIIMHDTDWNMMAATPQNLDLRPEMRFIIKGQAYRVTNVDNVSIDNVSIVSLVDDKLLDTDDRVNMIAYNDYYEYTLQSSLKEDMIMYAGDIKEIPITVLRQGKPVTEDIVLSVIGEKIVDVDDIKIIGRCIGETIVRCALKKNPTIFIDLPIKVTADHVSQEDKIYISGSDYIEWNTTEEYKLSNGDAAIFEVEVKSKIKKTIDFTDNSVLISIKDKYSGTIIITCDTSQGLIEKTVYIRTV